MTPLLTAKRRGRPRKYPPPNADQTGGQFLSEDWPKMSFGERVFWRMFGDMDATIDMQKKLILALAERVHKQAELLSRKAEAK